MKMKAIGVAGVAVGFLAGVLFSGIAVSISAKYMMITELKSPYDHPKTVSLIVERIQKQRGWHVVSVIDQQKEMVEHGGSPIGKYVIINCCSDQFAAEMLVADDRKRLGAMMPHAFAVYEQSEGQVCVASANWLIVGKLFGGETEGIIERVSREVGKILRFMNFKYSLF